METNMLFSQSCRVCSSEYENGINVFGVEGKKLYLETKIRKYLYITVTLEDRLPKIICDNCCKKLDGIHKFATMANKMQDKFNKLVINSQNDTIMEPKQNENKGLLHTYLTNGIKEKDNNVQPQDSEITEMEVRVDPMLVLQYSFADEDEYMSDNDSRTSQEKYMENENNIEDIFESNYHHKPYMCHSCPRRFTSEIALQSHMWSHIPKFKRVLLTNYNNAIYDPEKKDDKSIDGQNIFDKSGSNQTDDTEITDNDSCVRFTCPICGKIISTKGNLKVHLETHRPKGKYACDICGRIFKTQCNLHRHKEYHKGIQFPCVVCGRVYPTNSTLRAHSITHSNLRPHKCPLCDKTFKRNQDLKFHINQHTGARPYQCPYCPKAFASSGNCFSHRKRMHPIEVERDRERAAKIMR